MRRRQYIILAGAVIVLAGVIAVWPSGQADSYHATSGKDPESPAGHPQSGALRTESDPGRILTKRSVRDMGRKPTEEETIALLQNTIISKIDIEDATMEETVAELNRLSRSHGISERDLTFVIGHRLSTHLRSSPFRVRELRIRNVPLVILPKYVCDSTILRCRVSPGRVTFGLSNDFEEPAAPPMMEESGPDDDPFAEPGKKRPADPDDPFFPADSGEADPFAKPE